MNNPQPNPNPQPNQNPRPKKSLKKRVVFFILFILWSLIGSCSSYLKLESYSSSIKSEDMRFMATGMTVFGLRLCLGLEWVAGNWGETGLPVVLIPFVLINIPYSLATDIVMFPLDSYFYNKNIAPRHLEWKKSEKETKRIEKEKNNARQYWMRVFATGKTQHNTTKQYSIHFREIFNNHIEKPLNTHASLETVNTLWDLARENNLETIFPELATVQNLPDEQYQRFFDEAPHLEGYGMTSAVRKNLLLNPSTPDEIILKMGKIWFLNFNNDYFNLTQFIEKPRNIPYSLINKYYPNPGYDSDLIRYFVASSSDTPPDILSQFANDKQSLVVAEVAKNLNTPPLLLEKLTVHNDLQVKINVAKNSNTPTSSLIILTNDDNLDIRKFATQTLNLQKKKK